MKLAGLVTAAALAATCTSAATADDSISKPAHNGTNNATSSAVGRELQLVDIYYDSYYQLCGADIVGEDFFTVNGAHPDDCKHYCVQHPTICSGLTWTNYLGGTCWIKKTYNRVPPTTPNVGAVSFFLLTYATSSQISSDIADGYDIPGYDLLNTRGSDMTKCVSDCYNNRNCYAVTWTNHEGGTCWLKKRANSLVPKAGAKSAFVAKVKGFGEPDDITACPPV